MLAMLAGAIVSVAILSGRTGPADRYYTSFRDVSGVKFGTSVLYMGFPVGQVEKITPEWAHDGSLSFMLELSISKDWNQRIPTDSIARIRSAGILAAVAIDIRDGESQSGLSPGGFIEGIARTDVFAAMSETANTIRDLTEDNIKPLIINLTRYVDGFGAALETQGTHLLSDLGTIASELTKQAPEVIANFLEVSEEINATARRLQLMLGPENERKLEQILESGMSAAANVAALTSDENLAKTLGNIRAASENLVRLSVNANERLDDVLSKSTVEKARATLDDVAAAARNVAQLTTNLRSTSDRLGHLIKVLDEVATDNQPNVNQSLKDLRHSMQAISQHISSITYNLEGTSRNMYEFSRQLRQNPALLLGGTRPVDAAAAP